MLFNGDPVDQDELESMLKEVAKSKGKLNAERHHAIVAGVDLEEALGDLLTEFLVEHKQSRKLIGGALRNFAARINFAYCLGLISDDEYDDLHNMREIRNRFAHRKEGLSFNDEEIKGFCDSLKTLRKNPLEDDGYLSLYLSSAQILQYILRERAFEAQKRKCVAPEEFDPHKWNDM
jgi:hypothetical protein